MDDSEFSPLSQVKLHWSQFNGSGTQELKNRDTDPNLGEQCTPFKKSTNFYFEDGSHVFLASLQANSQHDLLTRHPTTG